MKVPRTELCTSILHVGRTAISAFNRRRDPSPPNLQAKGEERDSTQNEPHGLIP